MLKYIAATVLLWFTVRINMGVDLQAYHQELIAYLTDHQRLLFAGTAAGCLACYGVVYLMDLMGLHSLMYLLSKMLLETSRLVISLVFVGALFLYFDLGANLWLELGIIMAVPMALLATAIFCIRLFDFNFPLQDTFASSLAVPLFSGIVIFGSSAFGL